MDLHNSILAKGGSCGVLPPTVVSYLSLCLFNFACIKIEYGIVSQFSSFFPFC